MKIYKKIKEKIEKHDLIFIMPIIAIALSIFTLGIKFNANDELWNLSNIYKMYNGGMIYRDCNVIITPLFFYCGEIIFKLIGANYLSFRIYSIIINTSLIALIYVLFKRLKLPKRICFLNTIIIFLIIIQTILSGANYNIMAIAFAVCGMIIEISDKKQSIKSILQGIIIFLIFFTKQNIGVYYIIGLIVYHIIDNHEQKNIKNTILNIFTELSVAFILLVISFIYMYFNGNLKYFINYTFLGMKEFTQNFAIEQIYYIINCIIQIIFIILFKIVLDKILDIKVDKSSNIILIMGIVFIANQYPIFNMYHYIISIIIISIYILYIFDKVLIKIVPQNVMKKIITIMNTISIIAVLVIGVPNIIIYFNKLHKENIPYSNIYYGVNITEEQEKDIDQICTYIMDQKNNGIDVKIISYKAMMYMTPLNINNGDFDLVFLGNLGIHGEDGIIEKIKKLQDTRILITINEEDKLYQESKKVREYIMENLENDGSIGDFLIYKSTNNNK